MTSDGPRPTLLVQGWTGINHSYAMVNQYQLLELARMPGLDLYTQQVPLFDPRWSVSRNASGFQEAQQRVLDGIAPYAGQPVSAVYRIHTPNSLRCEAVRVMTFMVTELGLDGKSFTPQADVQAYQAGGNLVVTPSQWSKQRLVDYGFEAQRIFVVPHGVDADRFFPMASADVAAARSALGYGEGDTVFLNVGAPFWNKGMDLIIEAFFRVRQTCKGARLLIKDQQALYGLSAVNMIKDLAAQGRIQVDNDSVESIRILPQTLSREQIQSLYNVADFYLSPYRAEGFNLPVIEAIASGTRAIVTAGGSTDDFCDADTAIRIPSTLHTQVEISGNHVDAYLQPDLDALVQIMRDCCTGPHVPPERFHYGRANLLTQFTWQRAAQLIAALI